MTCPRNTPPLPDFSAACDFFMQTFREHPERDGLTALDEVLAGGKPRYAVIGLNYRAEPDDVLPPGEEIALPEIAIADAVQAGVAREMLQMLRPLSMLNPVYSVFGTGKGTGSLVPSFGIPLNEALDNTPAYTVTLEEILARPEPDPATSGILPEIRARIAMLDALAPAHFRIAYPDLQGPFNLAHAMIGTEAFTAPYEEEAQWDEFMRRLIRFWIAVQKNLMAWIPPGRRAPLNRYVRIAECSVNLVSADFYREFILPYDRMIADSFGALHIHPCSGPHVFQATLESLPVAVTEAGKMIHTHTTAGSIAVDDALALIGARDVRLLVGQELPEGGELDVIATDLEISRRKAGIWIGGYTGVHWKAKDRPAIRELHRRIDDLW